MLSIGLWRWYINITITILDIIHRFVLYLKHDESETALCLRLQVEPERWIMSRTVIVILLFHLHKPVFLIYTTEKSVTTNLICIVRCFFFFGRISDWSLNTDPVLPSWMKSSWGPMCQLIFYCPGEFVPTVNIWMGPLPQPSTHMRNGTSEITKAYQAYWSLTSWKLLFILIKPVLLCTVIDPHAG
jgi:hypothetical protein